MPDHPSALDLESLATGEEQADVRAHVEGCDACKMHINAISRAKREIPSSATFLKELKDRSKARQNVDAARRVNRFTAIAAGLALAAGLVLYIRTTSSPREGPTAGAPEIRLKGSSSLFIIRDRKGVQERFSSPCRARPGDRLLLEFAVADKGPIEAGVLTKAGEWLELQPAADFERGTYSSVSSLRIDDAGLEGRAMVGPPAEIAHARKSEPAKVTTVAIERDPSP